MYDPVNSLVLLIAGLVLVGFVLSFVFVSVTVFMRFVFRVNTIVKELTAMRVALETLISQQDPPTNEHY